MSAAAWIPLITGAIELALAEGKRRGLGTPSADDLRDAANAAAALVLPAAILGVTAATTLAAAEIGDTIASLGEVERCQRCGGVLTIHNGDAGRFTTCDNCDPEPRP